MGYIKKQFEGKYLEWYTIISKNMGDTPEINEYSPVKNNIGSLDWQGENKESVTTIVDSIDKTCQNLYQDISKNINKIKTCTGPLYSDLSTLKSKCEEYNSYVDDYYTALEEQKEQEDSEDS